MKANEFKAAAYYTICNYGGIEVMVNQYENKVIYKYFGSVAQRWQPIKYTKEGRTYFVVYKTKYYLDEFVGI